MQSKGIKRKATEQPIIPKQEKEDKKNRSSGENNCEASKQESSNDYAAINQVLRQVQQQKIKERKIEKEPQKQEEKKVEIKIREEKPILNGDGKSVFLTALNFTAPEGKREYHLEFLQLMSEKFDKNIDTLQSAFLSTFCNDPDLSLILPLIQKKILINLVKLEDDPNSIKQMNANFYLIQPLSPQSRAKQFYSGTFHFKLFLLKFPSKLRVVICSANLMDFD